MLRSFIPHSKYYEADKGDNPAGGTSQSTDSDKTEEKKFTQSEMEAVLKDRLARADRKAKEAADKAKSEAEQKALAEQGEFKTLAEQRASELATLTTELETAKAHESTVEKYKKALTERLKVEKQAYPAHVVSLLDKLDPLEQMEWITANADALKPATDTSRTYGTPPRNAAKPGERKTDAPARQSSDNDDTRSRFTL